MSEKIVLIESGRLDTPFLIRLYVKETDAVVHFTRLNHDPSLDKVEYVTRKKVFAIKDKSEFAKYEKIQSDFKEEYLNLSKKYDNIVNEVKKS